jgi:glycosyltransferase involved in cell wall biosynthesis
VRLTADLPRDRVEPHLALVAQRGGLLDQLAADVPLHDLRARRVRRAPRPLLALLRRLRPEVVLSTLGHLNLPLIALRPFFPRGTRLAVREANTASAALAGERHPSAWRLAYRLLYPRADAVVCPSRAVLEDLARSFAVPRPRLVHIPNPIDAGAIRREADREGSPYSSPGPNVLAVGRLEPQKGFPRLLDAFEQVARRFPYANLWILGEGSERATLEGRAQGLGIADRVRLPGRVPNPFPWMRHAAVFVQSSDFEGLPNALLEALAVGVPVVAVDEPGGTREIIEGLPGATLVSSGAPSDLAAAIERVLSGERPERPFLPESFRADRVVRDYVEFFERLAG